MTPIVSFMQEQVKAFRAPSLLLDVPKLSEDIPYLVGQVLLLGIKQYEAINHLDESYRRLCLKSPDAWESSTEQYIVSEYRDWYSKSQKTLEMLHQLDQYDHEIVMELPHYDQFKQAVEEVAGILTPDEEFFSSEELREAGEKAISDHRNGLCENMG
ncbi:MAG: hypothetical protein Tsb009_08460 [Planctomycetaceae bacterium]